jgi:3-hydroxymyristoyl/3-hydroxydecanoyl-(acyl carrier protein) dehydratase
MTWLDHLPHQIPFRAASSGVRVDDHVIEGTFVCTTNDALPFGVMVIEAMAQLAGGLVFDGQGLLTGIDACEIDRAIAPGDVIRFVVTLDAAFGGTFRFSGRGSMDGVEVARGRFYLASSNAHP